MQFLTLLGALALATSIAAQTSTGQACPANSVSRFEKCTCPYGTDYQYSTTYAILGVSAKDFSAYTSSCMYQTPLPPPFQQPILFPSCHSQLLRPVYNIAWQGITNLTRNGPDKTVGATRTYLAPTSVGTLTFTEKVRSFPIILSSICLSSFDMHDQLDSFQALPDGSYVARFSQFNTPIEYGTGNGSFSGYWITFDAEYAAEYETALTWSIYACFTGFPYNFGVIHVRALKDLLAVMDKAGLVKGNTTGPYYVQNF